MGRPSSPALAAALLAMAMIQNGASAQCTAPESWFPHEQTPEPDFHAPGSNCEFHQWAWQMFLWLTQPTGEDRIRLMDLPRADDLFMPGRGPATLSAEALDQFQRQALILAPRVTKEDDATSFGEIRQAGSKGVLVDRKGRPVYFASHVTLTYYQFVRSNRLFVKQNYLDAPDTLNFPVRSVELKSSWRVVPDDESADGFFTTTAQIQPVVCKNGEATCQGDDIVVDLTRVEQVKVALVGLHVVGVVEDHPEFIWSTFEHGDNAPDLPAGMSPTSDDPVSDRNFTFYAAGTPAKACNVRNDGSVPDMIVQLNMMAQTLEPVTNVFRQFAFGGGNPQDRLNIESLNRSVHDQLANDSVWRHYFLVGGVWFNQANGLQPGLAGPLIQQRVVGSMRLSNTTMETFTQRSNPNCFACHDTGAELQFGLPPKNLNISHVLMNGLVQREELRMASARQQFAVELDAAPLQSYAEVQAMLNDFVEQNQVPIDFAPHGAFWRNMSYEEFTVGDIPGVADPTTGEPLRVMIPGDSQRSNIILALLGAEGTIFDPINGTIGRMPPTGPFMPDADIARITDWIDRGAPRGP